MILEESVWKWTNVDESEREWLKVDGIFAVLPASLMHLLLPRHGHSNVLAPKRHRLKVNEDMWREAHVHRGIVVSSWNGFFRQFLGQARCQMRGGHLTALSCWSTRVQKNKSTGVQKYKSTEVEKFTKLYCSPSLCEAFLVPCSGVLNCLKSYLSLETAQQYLFLKRLLLAEMIWVGQRWEEVPPASTFSQKTPRHISIYFS